MEVAVLSECSEVHSFLLWTWRAAVVVLHAMTSFHNQPHSLALRSHLGAITVGSFGLPVSHHSVLAHARTHTHVITQHPCLVQIRKGKTVKIMDRTTRSMHICMVVDVTRIYMSWNGLFFLVYFFTSHSLFVLSVDLNFVVCTLTRRNMSGDLSSVSKLAKPVYWTWKIPMSKTTKKIMLLIKLMTMVFSPD